MLYIVLLSVCTFATLVGMGSVWRVTVNGRRSESRVNGLQTTPVSVLKPLCGADDQLEDNLETFFRQDHACFELIFGVEGVGDPAIPIVHRLQRRFPRVASTLVVHSGGRGINPKVSNLRHMVEHARFDAILVSDSNIAAPPAYVAGMVEPLADPRVGMVTSLFRGQGERSLGATLENLQLNGPVVAAVASSFVVAGRPVTVGKSILFRRAVFERLGGLESLASLLAEDYVMGRMFREAGYDVRLSSVIVDNLCMTTTITGFLRRHTRWATMRWRLNPFNYAAEPLGSPVALALLAPVFGFGLAIPLAWAALLTLLRDAVQWGRMRGWPGLFRALPLGLVKDLLMLGVWARAPFVRHVAWRGNRLRLSAGTRLYSWASIEHPLAAPARGGATGHSVSRRTKVIPGS